MEFDFGGYATKNDVLCADGRKIRKNAFKSQNGTKVPLVWMHQRNDPENVIGHAYLENRDDGVYAYCKLNSSRKAKHTKLLVQHGDVNSLSIFANQLTQKGADVMHGLIREVSVVIAPANPEALIDNPVVQHGDEEYEDTSTAMIYYAQPVSLDDVDYDVEHSDDSKPRKKPIKDEDPDEDNDESEDDEEPEDNDPDDEPDDTPDESAKNKKEDAKMTEEEKKKKAVQHADEPNKDDGEETVQDVYDSLTDKQKKVVAYIVGEALAQNEAEQSDMEGEDFNMRNVFDQSQELEMSDDTPALSHDQINSIFEGAKKCGSLKQSFLEHAQEYGIENIDILFPDAKAIANEPYMLKRDTEWVQIVLNETNHVPFSRIKSTIADITADEARAKGYVKGNLKKEEVIKLLRRVTTPTTVYKKQKLDRDDILDITEFNVVAWLKAEMRVMLNEELARAFLIGDGREIDDEDKIDEEHIRPIWKDDDMYAHHVEIAADQTPDGAVEDLIRARKKYKGSGSPTLFVQSDFLTDLLLVKDKIGRRLYNTEQELASALRVSKIVEVPVMDDQTRTADGKTLKLLGIVVNLRDYTVGATSGGQVSMFDDFDIDYNQYKYLMETRCCGALVMPKSALVLEQVTTGGNGTSLEPDGTSLG